jgi:hypothetical protein
MKSASAVKQSVSLFTRSLEVVHVERVSSKLMNLAANYSHENVDRKERPRACYARWIKFRKRKLRLPQKELFPTIQMVVMRKSYVDA